MMEAPPKKKQRKKKKKISFENHSAIIIAASLAISSYEMSISTQYQSANLTVRGRFKARSAVSSG